MYQCEAKYMEILFEILLNRLKFII